MEEITGGYIIPKAEEQCEEAYKTIDFLHKRIFFLEKMITNLWWQLEKKYDGNPNFPERFPIEQEEGKDNGI